MDIDSSILILNIAMYPSRSGDVPIENGMLHGI